MAREKCIHKSSLMALMGFSGLKRIIMNNAFSVPYILATYMIISDLMSTVNPEMTCEVTETAYDVMTRSCDKTARYTVHSTAYGN